MVPVQMELLFLWGKQAENKQTKMKMESYIKCFIEKMNQKIRVGPFLIRMVREDLSEEVIRK